MDGRAQVSVEVLLVALVILAISTSVLSYFFTINDSTTAMQLLKLSVLNKMGELDSFASIEKIDFGISGSTITLDLYIKSSETITAADLDLSDIETLIVKNTKFDFATINLIQS